MEKQILNALQDPEKVVGSRSDKQVRLYYRFEIATSVGGKWLCVVVKETHEDAFILTAYLTDTIKGGITLWDKE